MTLSNTMLLRMILALFSSAATSCIKVSPLATGPWGDRNPVASKSAVVFSGRARFTVLTPHLLRMEWDSSESFEDRATMAFINRNLDVPSYKVFHTDETLIIETSALQLSYSVGEAFAPTTLRVTSLDPSSAFEGWHYTQADTGNLLGTIRTLDNEDVPPLNCTLVVSELDNQCGWDETNCNCEWGVISRNGWTVVDDAQNYAFDNESDWWVGKNTDEIDSYLFAHGRDYKAALQDFVSIGGRIALTPRHAHGVWWTRWYDFTQDEVLSMADQFADKSLPLDIMILDMNWHTKDDWTGYTFDSRLYPYPADLLAALKEKGLITAANLHDASGVNSWEAEYGNMCAALGLDAGTGLAVPFNISDQPSQMALEDVVLGAVEELGMDFWWIDWQQGDAASYGADEGKKNPTIWTSHMRSTDRQRRGDDTRGMVLSRWGGLGGHRYQVGFSGDVKDINWMTLGYQPYFSATAANVGYGWWSHDIVGPADDVELYTRWFQWGAFSGVMRMHDRGISAGDCADSGDGCYIDMPWLAPPKNYDAMRGALRAREALLPYLYTAAYTAHKTGLSTLRPLYYDFPEETVAYGQSFGLSQYTFGPDLVVSPVVTPANETTQLVQQKMWVPPGKWIDRATGTLYTGTSTPVGTASNTTCSASSSSRVDCAPPFLEDGCRAKGCCWDPSPAEGTPQCFFSEETSGLIDLYRPTDLDEVPTLVRAGAVLPLLPIDKTDDVIGIASRAYAAVDFEVFVTGASSGRGDMYEDDGITIAYATSDTAQAMTSLIWKYTGVNRSAVAVKIETKGGYPALPLTRDYRLVFKGSPPAEKVVVAGHEAEKGGDNVGVSYDGSGMALRITVSDVSVAEPLTLRIDLACPGGGGSAISSSSSSDSVGCGAGADALLSGAAGVFARSAAAKATLDEARLCPGESDVGSGALQRLASTPSSLTHNALVEPALFWSIVRGLPGAVAAASAEVESIVISDDASSWRVVRALALLSAA